MKVLVVFGVLLAMTTPLTSQETAPTTQARGRGPIETDAPSAVAVKAFIDAINRHDLAAMAALMPENHAFTDSSGQTVKGRAAMVASWPKYFAMFPDYRIETDDIIVRSTLVAVFGRWSATYAGARGSNGRVGGPAAWRAEVVDGKIAVWQVYCDHTRTLEVVRNSSPK